MHELSISILEIERNHYQEKYDKLEPGFTSSLERHRLLLTIDEINTSIELLQTNS